MDLLVRPTAETGLFVLSDIRTVNGSKGHGKSPPAGVLCFLGYRMTGAAAGQSEDILALGCKFLGICLSVSCDSERKNRAEKKKQTNDFWMKSYPQGLCVSTLSVQ